ncbi:hypothetical protein BKI52_41040 [marine bacterium AO1-C]|nr:hypothetical protein BKI52_41040 [marine bacterium AO1-C]
MNWRSLLFLPAIIITFLTKTNAQTGALYVQHYGTPITHLTNQNRAFATTNQGTMMVANAQGALHYDGENWQLLDTKATLYALLSDSNRVYTGGRSSFGYLERQNTGKYKYFNLTNADKKMPPVKGNFWLIGSNQQHVYFLSEKLLVQFDKKEGKVTKFWAAKKGQPYTGLVVWQKKIFVNIGGKGLHQLVNGAFKLFTQGGNFKDIQMTSVFTSKYLPFFTANNNFLYRYDGTVWRKVPIKDQEYLNKHTLTTGSISNDRYVALGTLDGGVVLLDIYEKTKTLHIINNQTGLLDDEIFSLGYDQQAGLWIAHPLGISRAAMNLPIRSFQHYPGVVGNLTAVTRWQNKLYVATTEGVFYLQKTKNYQDLVKYVTTQQENTTKEEEPVVTKIIKEKGGGTVVGNFLNKTFGKKKEQVVIIRKPKVTRKKNVQTQKTTERLLQQQIYALKSFPYFFQKVNGFEGKVNRLLALPNQLLIGSSKGLYQYQNNTITEILPNVYVNQLKLDNNTLNIATNSGLRRVQKNGNGWKVVSGFAQVKTPVYSLVQIGQQIWLGSENEVMKVTLNAQGAYQGMQHYALPQYYLEKVQLAAIKNQPVLFLSDGMYRLNKKGDKFAKDTTTKAKRLPYQTIQGQGNEVWTDIQRKWVNIQEKGGAAYLALFGKIDDIYQDTKKNQLWVVHQNLLHSIPDTVNTSKAKSLEVLIHSVTNLKNKELSLDKIRLRQGTKAYGLKIQMSLPYYLDENSVEYQYRIKGLTRGWTPWQKSPELLLNLLPRGKHTLEIKARNGLGQESTIKQLKIRVIPPFWKTWWFFLIEISVLVALLLAAALSSRFSKFERYSYILTFVTIITVFEFVVLSLEPSVDDFSGGVPVLKLAVNIILAISLNPIERRLAAWLSKNKYKMHA